MASETAMALAKLVEDIDIAMFTTVGPGGYLVSRPLSTQAARFDGERVWFFVDSTSQKCAEIGRNRKVNVAYASQDRNTYVSLAGDARVTRDRARIDEFWNDALEAFFPRGKDDPDLALIEVTPRTAEYWDGPGSLVGKALTFAAALITGNDDVMGDNAIVDFTDGRVRTPPSSDHAPSPRRAQVAKVGRALTGARKVGKKAAPAKKVAKAPSKKTVALKKASTKRAANKGRANKRGR